MPLDFAWLGQGPAIDLANTYVPAQDADLLDAWPVERKAELPPADLRELRTHVTALLRALTRGGALPGDAVRALNDISARHPAYATLRRRRLVRHDPLAGATARDAFGLVAGGARIGVCDAPGCGMLFRATRPEQPWRCASRGNRARGARHHRRTRAHPRRTETNATGGDSSASVEDSDASNDVSVVGGASSVARQPGEAVPSVGSHPAGCQDV